MDETKRPIYRAIVEKYLNGTNLGHIAIWLTDNKIPTPYSIKPDGKNKGWSILRFNGCWQVKSIWVTSHMVIPVQKEERIKVMGTHEKLKTPEEHEQVILERKGVRSRQIQKLEEELKELRKIVVDEGYYPTVEQIYDRIGDFREL